MSAARAVNRDLIQLYWDIGRGIVEKQQILVWGESVIEKIATDLRLAFPAGTGFSPRNLRNMKQFFQAYSRPEFWKQTVAKMPGASNWQQAVANLEAGLLPHILEEIPWGHHILLLNKQDIGCRP